MSSSSSSSSGSSSSERERWHLFLLTRRKSSFLFMTMEMKRETRKARKRFFLFIRTSIMAFWSSGGFWRLLVKSFFFRLFVWKIFSPVLSRLHSHAKSSTRQSRRLFRKKTLFLFTNSIALVEHAHVRTHTKEATRSRETRKEREYERASHRFFRFLKHVTRNTERRRKRLKEFFLLLSTVQKQSLSF